MHKLHTRVAVLFLVLAICVPFAGYAASGITSNVQGTATNGSRFVGSLTVNGFQLVNNAIVATGNLVGTVFNSQGAPIGSVNQAVQVPVPSTNGTCTVLTLNLGPLDLNLLGLQVHLNQVVLTITADPTGGLLGQLLCSLAGGINLNATLSQIVGLLNSILGAL